MQVSSLPPKASAPLKMVALGDSLTAGMQDVNLIGERQQVSYPNLIARQAGLSFRQPLLSKQGIPPRLLLSPGTSLGQTAWRYAQVGLAAAPAWITMSLGFVPPPILLTPIYYAGGMGRPQQHGPFQNLAIPGYEARHLRDVDNVKDLCREMVSGAHGSGELIALGPYVKHILQDGRSVSKGKSELTQAIEQKPDVVLLWAGNNDALATAIKGGTVDDRELTPMEDKKWVYKTHDLVTGQEKVHVTKQVMPGYASTMAGPDGIVTQLLAKTSAEVVMMNIPDVTVVPFLHKVGQKVGKLPFRLRLPGGVDVTEKLENWTLPARVKGPGLNGRTHFPEGSVVGIATILSKLTHVFQVKTEGDVERALGVMASAEDAAFRESDVLDPAELGQVQERTAKFNALLADLAEHNRRIHLVDTNGMLNRLKTEGIPLRGQGPEVTLTNTFTGQKDADGREGMFSGDGVHPSDVGYAVVANQILDTLRKDLGGDPKFAALTQAPPVDEKAALAADPHRAGERPTVILDSWVTEQLMNAL